MGISSCKSGSGNKLRSRQPNSLTSAAMAQAEEWHLRFQPLMNREVVKKALVSWRANLLALLNGVRQAIHTHDSTGSIGQQQEGNAKWGFFTTWRSRRLAWQYSSLCHGGPLSSMFRTRPKPRLFPPSFDSLAGRAKSKKTCYVVVGLNWIDPAAVFVHTILYVSHTPPDAAMAAFWHEKDLTIVGRSSIVTWKFYMMGKNSEHAMSRSPSSSMKKQRTRALINGSSWPATYKGQLDDHRANNLKKPTNCQLNYSWIFHNFDLLGSMAYVSSSCHCQWLAALGISQKQQCMKTSKTLFFLVRSRGSSWLFDY